MGRHYAVLQRNYDKVNAKHIADGLGEEGCGDHDDDDGWFYH